MSTLYIIATPIGNLSDLTERAKQILSEVDAILCEDTRVTGKLMSHLELEKELVSYHQHSDDSLTLKLIERLRGGQNLALVTDAGTPGISDPGGKLIEKVVFELGDYVTISPIPGANAAIAALSISGFPADEFLFLGFPPVKKGRAAYFDRIAETSSTIVFYESTHRIEKTLGELSERIGDRKIVVGRELTKLHETIYRGTVTEVTEQLKATSIKGEFVLVIDRKK